MKISLLKKQLIDTEEIPTKSGRVIVLKLTRIGKRLLNNPIEKKSIDIKEGGVTHEYWKKATSNWPLTIIRFVALIRNKI